MATWFLFQPEALPPEVCGRVHHDVKRDMGLFLTTCKFVKPSCTSSLAEFDRSEIITGRLLGSGGFNSVYEIKDLCPSVRDTEEEPVLRRRSLILQSRNVPRGKRRPYVMKHIHQDAALRMDHFKRAALDLLIETHFMASISHPHVLTVRGFARDGAGAYADGRPDSFFLILDRLEETLEVRIQHWEKRLRRRKLQEVLGDVETEESFLGRLTISRDLASGLLHLHNCGIIYRDMKPTNIGFDEDGVVKLFDFGLSREMPKGSSANEVYGMSGQIGTQRYVPCEVCNGQPYNQSADVYSFSLVIWEMLALEKPFKDMDQEKHIELVIDNGERPKLDTGWPSGVKAMLQRGWSQNWQNRPSMKDLHQLLLREISEIAVSAGKEGSEGESTTILQTQRTTTRLPSIRNFISSRTREDDCTISTRESVSTAASELPATKRNKKKRSMDETSRMQPRVLDKVDVQETLIHCLSLAC